MISYYSSKEIHFKRELTIYPAESIGIFGWGFLKHSVGKDNSWVNNQLNWMFI